MHRENPSPSPFLVSQRSFVQMVKMGGKWVQISSASVIRLKALKFSLAICFGRFGRSVPPRPRRELLRIVMGSAMMMIGAEVSTSAGAAAPFDTSADSSSDARLINELALALFSSDDDDVSMKSDSGDANQVQEANPSSLWLPHLAEGAGEDEGGTSQVSTPRGKNAAKVRTDSLTTRRRRRRIAKADATRL